MITLWTESWKMLKLLIFVLSFSGAMLTGTTARAQAHQSAASASRTPVLLALVDTLPKTEARFRIVRVAGAPAQDVVLLPVDADPELLTDALETLRMIWAASATGGRDTPEGVFRRAHGRTESGPRRVIPWGERVMSDLRKARERHVPGVGYVRAVRIWLAPHPATESGQHEPE
jgi:hypothetical protein